MRKKKNVSTKLQRNETKVPVFFRNFLALSLYHIICSPFWKMVKKSDKSKNHSVFFWFASFMFSPLDPQLLSRKFSLVDPTIAVEKPIRAYNSRLTKLSHPWSSVLAQQLRCICCVFFRFLNVSFRAWCAFLLFLLFHLVFCSVYSFLCMKINNNNDIPLSTRILTDEKWNFYDDSFRHIGPRLTVRKLPVVCLTPKTILD